MQLDGLDVTVLAAFLRVAGRPGGSGVLFDHEMSKFATEGVEPASARAVIDTFQTRAILERRYEVTQVSNPQFRRLPGHPAFAAFAALGGEPEFIEGRGRAYWVLTKAGAALAAALGEQSSDEARDQGGSLIPASDRMVALDDNQSHVREAREALREVAERVRSANDLVADPEDRSVVLSEVEGLGRLLNAPRARIAALAQSVEQGGVVAYLAQQTASAYVQEVAKKLYEALRDLVRNHLGLS